MITSALSPHSHNSCSDVDNGLYFLGMYLIVNFAIWPEADGGRTADLLSCWKRNCIK